MFFYDLKAKPDHTSVFFIKNWVGFQNKSTDSIFIHKLSIWFSSWFDMVKFHYKMSVLLTCERKCEILSVNGTVSVSD